MDVWAAWVPLGQQLRTFWLAKWTRSSEVYLPVFLRLEIYLMSNECVCVCVCVCVFLRFKLIDLLPVTPPTPSFLYFLFFLFLLWASWVMWRRVQNVSIQAGCPRVSKPGLSGNRMAWPCAVPSLLSPQWTARLMLIQPTMKTHPGHPPSTQHGQALPAAMAHRCVRPQGKNPSTLGSGREGNALLEPKAVG